MGKSKSKKTREDLSPLALVLLREMAKEPDRIEYHTRVLGGSFQHEAVRLLDDSYSMLARLGLIEATGTILWFFGAPKPLYRVTESGRRRAGVAA